MCFLRGTNWIFIYCVKGISVHVFGTHVTKVDCPAVTERLGKLEASGTCAGPVLWLEVQQWTAHSCSHINDVNNRASLIRVDFIHPSAEVNQFHIGCCKVHKLVMGKNSIYCEVGIEFAWNSCFTQWMYGCLQFLETKWTKGNATHIA
jgi:hypothetical protein